MSSVTSSNQTRIVFCEGQTAGENNASTTSPDILLLSQLLINQRADQPPRYRIEIKSIGGKQAARNFAHGYELATRNPNWLILTDRDLDKPPEQNKLPGWNKRHSVNHGF